MLHRVDTMAEKAGLGPARWHSLTNRTHSMPILLAWIKQVESTRKDYSLGKPDLRHEGL